MFLKSKKGVALVTVLLFMTIATIAATAVYKWLNSAERASASRLKQSEAYLASQAGLNAARAWLAYNGEETAGLVTQLMNGRSNGVVVDLGNKLTAMSSDLNQSYSVVATEAVPEGGSVKLKLVSTGNGRHGSKYSQVAILKITGLYQINPPSSVRKSKYKYSYFGGTLSINGGGHKKTSMLINGDYNASGEAASVEEDVVVTGNLNVVSGGAISVGGTTCVGGHLVMQNDGVELKDVYVAGKSDATTESSIRGEIGGTSFFEGNVNLTGNSDISFGGNATFNGRVNDALGEHAVTFQEELCLTNTGKFHFNRPKPFKAIGDVWMPNGANIDGSIGWGVSAELTSRPSSSLHLGENFYDYKGGYGLNICKVYGGMGAGAYPLCFTSKSNDKHIGKPLEHTCQQDAKDYCMTFFNNKAAKTCDGSKFTIQDMVSLGNFESKANSVTTVSAGVSVSDIVNWGSTQWRDNDAIGKLNAIYAATDKRSTELYGNGGFMVIKPSSAEAFENTGSKTLNGNFIFIFEERPSVMKLPQTTEGKSVLIFLKKGAGAIELEKGDAGKYGYFIYTKGDIDNIKNNGTLKGSVYAEAASCAKLGNLPSTLNLEFDQNIVDALSDAGAICDFNGGSACQEIRDDSTPSSSSSDSGTELEISTEPWIPFAPQLKIDLATQYANNEEIDLDNSEMLDQSLVVIPRVIYTNIDSALSKNGKKVYTVMYLGGLVPQSGSATCHVGTSESSGTSISETTPFSVKGLHTCVYEEDSKKSKFWVYVVDEGSTSLASFDMLYYMLDSERCQADNTKQVSINIPKQKGGKLKLTVYNQSNESAINLTTTLSGTGYTMTQKAVTEDAVVYELTVADGVSQITPFSIIVNDCGSATGSIQFKLEDEDYSDEFTTGNPSNELVMFGAAKGIVRHGELSADPNILPAVSDTLSQIPDCDESAFGENGVSWGAYIDGNEGCNEGSGFDKSTGPWECDIEGKANPRAYMKASGYDEEKCIVRQENFPVIVNGSVTMAYASLKKRHYTLTVKISGLKGSAHVLKGDPSDDGKGDDEDFDVSIYDSNNNYMGTCKTGNSGKCSFTVYYDETYYARATGRNFNHWSSSDNSLTDINNRRITVRPEGNMTIIAYFTNAGYCFVEDFKNLYSYCDREVSGAYLGGVKTSTTAYRDNSTGTDGQKGGYFANIANDYNQFAVEGSVYSVAEGKFVTLDRAQHNPVRVAMRDFGREPASAENDYQAKYCIDQCVSNRIYRFTPGQNFNDAINNIMKNGAPSTSGTNYTHYYGIYCDVEGETLSELDSYTYMDKYSVADKEDLNTGVWSYFDPGERELGKYNASDRHYRGVKAAVCLPDTCSTPRCCEENVDSHPPILDAPRVKGGYYAQDDTLSPWLKVIMTQGVQQPKGGPMRPSQTTQWNEKPFINRNMGYATHAYNNEKKVQQMILRKHQAGYNGTLRETIKITGSEGIESWGSKTSLIFRAKSDLSSFFTLAIDPAGDTQNKYTNVKYDPEGDNLVYSGIVSSTTTNTAHLQLCHCTEGFCYSKHPYYELGLTSWSPGWETAGNPDSTAKYGEKYAREENGYYRNEGGVDNLGHCTWEKVKTNIPFNQLVGKVVNVTIDLDGPYADIELAYESDDGTNMVYSDYHVNLEDPEVFHYSRADNPITAMRNDTASHRYVGFNVHSAVVKFYNVSWRSGGNCEEGTTTEPSIYCGYDNPYVAINTKDRPKAYVTDYCPDGGECECTPTFYLNGSKWDGTFRSVATYGKGALQVKMECKDLLGYEDANGIRHYKENWVGRAPCAAFSTYDRGSDENMCTDSYHIFVDNQYEQRRGYPYIYLYGSEISGFDSTYSYQGVNNGGVSEKGLYTNVYLSGGFHYNQSQGANTTCGEKKIDGTCKYWIGDNSQCSARKADGECSGWTNNPSGTLIHPYKSGELGTVKNPDLIKVSIDNTGKWTWGETTKYIQLRDSVTGSHRLNLNGATFSFDILQPNNATAIEYWFVDSDGGESRHIPLDSVNYIAGMEVDGRTPGPETNGKYGISGYCLKDNKYYRVDNCDEHLTLNYNANGSVNSVNRKPNDKNDAGFYIDYFEKSGAASYHKIPYGGKPDASMEYKAYDCCQRGLIWWRDAKGGDTPVNRHISVKVDMSLDSVMFKPDRVSRIYYRLENKPSYKEENPTYVYKKITDENEAIISTKTTYQIGDWRGSTEKVDDNNLGTFFHIGNIQSSCPSAFNLSNCQLNGVNRNVPTDPLVVYQGDRVTFSANLDNTSDCYFDGAGHSSSNTSDKVACTLSGKNSYSITFNSEMQNEPLTFTATSSKNGTTKSCVQYVTVKKKATIKDGFSCDETPTTYVKNGTLPKIEASLSEYDANLKYAIYAGGCGNSGMLIEGTEATLMGDISQSFEPTSGSGNYYLCYGHAKPYTQEICSKQVNVVENVTVSGCGLSPSTVNPLGSFDVSAMTNAPNGSACSVTINGSPYNCAVNNGTASLSGIAAPNTASDYPVTIDVLGTEENCGTLTVSAGITDASSCNTGNSTNIGTVENRDNAPSQHIYMTKNTGYYVNIPYKYNGVKLRLERLSGSKPVTFSIKKCDGSLGSITISSEQGTWNDFGVNIWGGTCNVFIVPDGDVEMNFNAW
ncbi:MAG: hypothetical protein MJY87_04465 [Fibrobacter sp.]|nr:hypothetical protein [Fibrobacter sp.]